MNNANWLMRCRDWLILATVFLVPLVFTVQQNTFALPKNALFRSLVSVTFALTIVLWMKGQERWRGGAFWLTGPLAAWVGFSFVSMLAGEVVREGFWGTYDRMNGWYTLLHFLLFYGLVVSATRTREGAQRLLGILILAASIVALYGIAQHYSWTTLKGDIAESVAQRAISTLGNALSFGGFLSITIPLTLSLALLPIHLRFVPRWLLLVEAGAQAMGLFFTQTRSAWGALIGGLMIGALLLLRQWYARRGLVAWGAALAAATVALIVVVQSAPAHPIIARITSVTDFETFDQSDAERFSGWRAGWESIKAYPWLGVGPDGFAQAFQQHYPSWLARYSTVLLDAAHNYFINIATTTGIPALLSFFAALVAAFVYVRKVLQGTREPIDRVIAIGIAAALVSYILQALFTIENVAIQMVLMMMLGILARLVGWCREPPYAPSSVAEPLWRAGKEQRSSPVVALGSVAIVVGVGWLVIATDLMPWYADYRFSRVVATRNLGAMEELYQNVLVRSPYRAQYAFQLARVFLEGSEYYQRKGEQKIARALRDRSLELLETSLAGRPQHAEWLRVAGAFYTRLALEDPSLWPQADEHYGRALELSPTRQRILWEWGRALVVRKDRRGIEKLEQAVAFDPQAGRSFYELGRGYEKMGERVKAQKAFAQAQELGFVAPR